MAGVIYSASQLESWPKGNKDVWVRIHTVGTGLYLKITPKGGRYYYYRYIAPTRLKHQKKLKLGNVGAISLSDVRKLHARFFHMVAVEKVCPVMERDTAKLTGDMNSTVNQLLNSWLDRQNERLAESTFDNYSRRADKHIRPAIGKLHVDEVKAIHIKAIVTKLEKSGKTAMAEKILSQMKSLFGFAQSELLVSENVANGLISNHDYKPKGVYLDDEQVKVLWRDLIGGMGVAESGLIAVKLLILTGLRKSSLIAMQWDWLKWNDDKTCAVAFIPAEHMNNRKPFQVYFPEFAVQLLNQLKQLSGSSKFVFPSPMNVSKPLSTNPPELALTTIANHRSWEGVSLHVLRHTFATGASRIGLDYHATERCLSHALKGTGRLYTHEMNWASMRKVWISWNDHIEAVIAGEKIVGEEAISVGLFG